MWLILRWFAITIAFVLVHASLTALAEPPQNRFLEVNGTKLHYLEAGKGAPILLIHGFQSSAAINWQMNGVINTLAKDFHVIAVDLPGHGRSDKPHNEAAYGMQLVEDMIAIEDHLQIDKAHIVGYSVGGIIAAKLAVTHPDRVRSGTLGGMGWLKAGSLLQDLWDQFPARENDKTPPEFIQSIGDLAITEEQLRSISVPMNVIVGERDPMRKLYVDPLISARPEWPIVLVTGAGHANCLVKPKFREEIVSWAHKQLDEK